MPRTDDRRKLLPPWSFRVKSGAGMPSEEAICGLGRTCPPASTENSREKTIPFRAALDMVGHFTAVLIAAEPESAAPVDLPTWET